MTITLEVLKSDETNMLAQLARIQGMLDYNRQQQAFVQKPEEEQKTENPPAEPASPIK